MLFHVLFVFLLGSFITDTTGNVTTTFEDTANAYTFNYPNNWTKNTTISGFDIFLLAPEESPGHSPANVSVLSHPIPADLTLATYSDENINNMLNDINVIDRGQTEIGGLPAVWIRYTRKDTQVEIVQYFIVKNSKGYLITGGAAPGTYDTYQSVFNEVVKSFKFN